MCIPSQTVMIMIGTAGTGWTGSRHQLGEVLGQEDQGALAEQVLDGVDGAVVDEGDAQQALVAGVAQLVGEQQGEVERGKLIDMLSRIRALRRKACLL